jgi:hypothetical protein
MLDSKGTRHKTENEQGRGPFSYNVAIFFSGRFAVLVFAVTRSTFTADCEVLESELQRWADHNHH